MYRYVLRLADVLVEISSRYDFSERIAKDYLAHGETAVLSVKASDESIGEAMEFNPENMPSMYSEWICIYRELAEQIPFYDRVVMHGAVISYKGQGLIFTAPSGTGKTTHIALWKSMFRDDVEIINGDKPILQITDSGAIVYGTPWSGKEGWHKNMSAPLKGICLLRRGTVNKIRRMEVGECLSQLLKQVYLPRNEQAAQKTLELFGKLVENVPMYILECDISEEAVKTAFEMLDEHGMGGEDSEN